MLFEYAAKLAPWVAIAVALGGLFYNRLALQLKGDEQVLTTMEKTLQAHIAMNEERISGLEKQLAIEIATCERNTLIGQLEIKACHQERDRLQRQIVELLSRQRIRDDDEAT